VTRLAIFLAAPALLAAQSAQIKHGAEIFRTTCGVAYCHGSEGTAGRAPRLAGRAFVPRELFLVILNGKPGTNMPPFAQQLKVEEIEAVTQYVLSLGGPAGAEPVSAKSAGPEPLPSMQKGRALFLDAFRMGGCGRCHELGDRGSAVGPDLSLVAAPKFRNLRSVSANEVVTITVPGEEPFPALVTEKTTDRVRAFDLSGALPVLRTLRPADVRVEPGSTWSHATVTESYSDSDLEAISGYLTWQAQAHSGK
jgi:mono/diheme cytochrome c family protein